MVAGSRRDFAAEFEVGFPLSADMNRYLSACKGRYPKVCKDQYCWARWDQERVVKLGLAQSEPPLSMMPVEY